MNAPIRHHNVPLMYNVTFIQQQLGDAHHETL